MLLSPPDSSGSGSGSGYPSGDTPAGTAAGMGMGVGVGMGAAGQDSFVSSFAAMPPVWVPTADIPLLSNQSRAWLANPTQVGSAAPGCAVAWGTRVVLGWC